MHIGGGGGVSIGIVNVPLSWAGQHFKGLPVNEVESLDTHPLEGGYGIRDQQRSIGAPPLNLRVTVSPHAQPPLSPLGLICDEREVCSGISTSS